MEPSPAAPEGAACVTVSETFVAQAGGILTDYGAGIDTLRAMPVLGEADAPPIGWIVAGLTDEVEDDGFMTWLTTFDPRPGEGVASGQISVVYLSPSPTLPEGVEFDNPDLASWIESPAAAESYAALRDCVTEAATE